MSDTVSAEAANFLFERGKQVYQQLQAAKAENAKLRAALEHITRECDALNQGPVAVAIAREALLK